MRRAFLDAGPINSLLVVVKAIATGHFSARTWAFVVLSIDVNYRVADGCNWSMRERVTRKGIYGKVKMHKQVTNRVLTAMAFLSICGYRLSRKPNF